ncbi:hypothetical protein ASD11_08150 [Aeromicrobium sp. Root495]|uniref:hypothetical protein n=1 Tax=Aeromicrobium sp. Root495 TaxID=1736550 RepID=UPI0006F287F3|nr:hypothetical protein [Aeromicrobium sp. Root495]KQY59521.1 hypothetical protein ASD11_08150 [Aeromicrobium sp. Root495]
MSTDYEATPSEVRTFALLQLALTAGFLLLIFWALDGTDADLPPWWVFVVLLVPVGVAAYFAEQVWLKTDPLDPAEDPQENERIAVGVFAAHSVRRLMICEAAIIWSIFPWSFLGSWAAWPIVIGGLPGFALLVFELWPSLRNVSMTAAILETEGADSRLVDGFRGW